MKPIHDLISIGDATLDTFVRVKEASVMCTVNKENCLLCFTYADKIPIERLDRTIAGNAANNAVGAARLGMQAALYSVIGDDKTGQDIMYTMKKEGVELDYLDIERGTESNYSVVLNYKGERTQLVYKVPRKYALPKLRPSAWVYYTEIGSNHSGLERDLVRYIGKTGAKLAYNPGTSHIREGLERMKHILRRTHTLFVNKEEGEKMVGKFSTMKKLLRALHAEGPKIVVVTDGSRGAYAYDGRHAFQIGVFPAKVVEMTGAGDSFATAFVAALHHGKSMHDALLWGSANSTSVIGKIGPQAGLLTQDGIKKMLKKNAKVKPRQL